MTLMEKFEFLKKYDKILKQAEFKIKGERWILISLGVSTIAFVLCYFAIWYFSLPFSQIISVALLLGILDMTLGYPYLKAVQRISEIEEMLPDALKQMADTLRAGGTYEFALREVVSSQYGPLSKELGEVLRKLEEGENLENSLGSFAEKINSRLVRRSMTVIIDSIKAGAGLADILDEISHDVREMHRLDLERKTQTVLQVWFIIGAGIFVSPAIFGLVSEIINIFVQASISFGLSEIEKTTVFATREFILTLMVVYLFIEITASSAMIALMRDGKIGKTIIYFPVLLLIAFVIYYTTSFAANLMIG